MSWSCLPSPPGRRLHARRFWTCILPEYAFIQADLWLTPDRLLSVLAQRPLLDDDVQVLADDHKFDNGRNATLSKEDRRLVDFMESQAAAMLLKTDDDGRELEATEAPADVRGGAPLRIHFDFSQMEDSGSKEVRELREFLRHQVLPSAAAEIAKMIIVREPSRGRLYIPTGCKDRVTVEGKSLCRRYEAGMCYKPDYIKHNPRFLPPTWECSGETLDSCVKKGGSDAPDNADLVIYVRAHDKHCTTNMAHATACSYDHKTRRPVYGIATFCPSNILGWSTDLEKLRKVALHELLHVLYFNGQLIRNYWRTDKGKRYLHNELVQQNSEGYTVLKTPRVLEEARRYFDCDSLEGVPLENKDGSLWSHWEAEYMKGDIMAASLALSGKSSFGAMTLAAAEDSGWYWGNWENVGQNTFGYKAGCEFLNHRCDEFIDIRPSQHFYCTRETKQVGAHCSSDRRYYAGCLGSDYHPKCGTLASPILMQLPSGETLRANCYDEANAVGDDYKGHFFGAHSRCIEPVDVVRTPDSKLSVVPKCVKMSCTDAGLLQLHLGETVVDCPSGEVVDTSVAEGWQGRLGPCPDNQVICPTLSCPKDCNGRGKCVDGQCRCQIGYIGLDCSEPVFTPGEL